MLQKLRQSLFLKELLPAHAQETMKPSAITQIKEGDTLAFGAMQQEELSKVVCYVGMPTVYHFAGNQFVSHSLVDMKGAEICTMIVAGGQHGATPYLALSRRISEVHKPYLCTEEDFNMVTQGTMPSQLYVREHTGGMTDWLHMRYELRINDVRGTTIDKHNEVRTFNYTLYAATKEAKALEIERYPSGECAIYATIFRPASDIVRITPKQASTRPASPRPRMTGAMQELNMQELRNVEMKDSLSSAIKKASQPEMTPSSDASEQKVVSLPVTNAAKAQKNTALVTSKQHLPVIKEDFGTIRCNLRMASKLIDEALKSDMRVVDVMRRALGLSVTDADSITFDLHLSDNDYKILADRFELSVHDKEAILALVVEELSHFTGERDDAL